MSALKRVTQNRLRSMVLVILLATSMMLSGCIFGFNQGPLAELEIRSDTDYVVFGEEIVLEALGISEKGATVNVSPEWRIISGIGGLRSQGSTAIFFPTDRQYSGEVEIEARVGEITKQISIQSDGLLEGNQNELIPEPTWNVVPRLPDKTNTSVPTVGSLDAYRMNREWELQVVPGVNYISIGKLPTTYVLDGVVTDPIEINPFADHKAMGWKPRYANHLIPAGKLPGVPHLSHHYYYEKLAEYVLDTGVSGSYKLTAKVGTSTTDATELVRSTYKELKGEAFWSWGTVSAEWSETVTSRVSSSVTAYEETTKEHQFSYTAAEPTLFTVWQRVDVFYVSDEHGVPVDKTDLFDPYKLDPFITEVRSNAFEVVNWKLP